VAHRRQRFAQKTIGSACVSPIQQHKVDQPAMLVNSSEQVLSAATDLHICLVHPPGGRAVALIPADPLLQFRRVTMDLAHDRRWFYLDTALLHHLRQFAIADPVLAVPANTHQDDEPPAKVAQVILQLASKEQFPAHLLLGSDAVQYARLAEEKRESDAKAWHNISVSTDAEDVKGLPDLKF
jgi:hypothetical protein